jgi:hypothetical protein
MERLRVLADRFYAAFANYFGIFIVFYPVLIAFYIGIYYAYFLLNNISSDTTSTSNYAFGITGALTALSFSGARAIIDNPDHADALTFSGEKFLHSTLLLILASLLKYNVLSMQSDSLIYPFLATIYGSLSFFLFMQAMLTAHCGVVVLNRTLWSRYRRRKEWDDFC